MMSMRLPTENTYEPGGNLRDLLHLLFKQKVKIVAIFLATVLITTVVSFIISPVYEASASLLVKIGREYIPIPEIGNPGNHMVVNQKELINSEIQILASWELHRRVITDIGLSALYPDITLTPGKKITPMEAALIKFSKNLKVSRVKDSNVITLSFQHRNPTIALQVVKSLIDFYKEKRLKVFSSANPSFFEKQLAQYQQRLRQSEDDLEAFKQSNQVYSLEKQRDLLLEQHIQLTSTLNKRQNRIDELEKKVSAYKKQLKDIAENPYRYTQTEMDKILVSAQEKLLNLQLKEKELLSKNYRPDGRMITNVRQEIRLVERFLKTTEREINRKVRTSNTVYQAIEKELLKAEVELEAERAGAALLAEQIAQLDREIENLDQKEDEIRSLERTLSINEQNYRAYVEKLEEARISRYLDNQKIDNVSIVQPPKLPQKPIKPKKRLAILLSMFLGLLSGVGYAVTLEYMSQRISTPRQMEKWLGLPMLASIELK